MSGNFIFCKNIDRFKKNQYFLPYFCHFCVFGHYLWPKIVIFGAKIGFCMKCRKEGTKQSIVCKNVSWLQINQWFLPYSKWNVAFFGHFEPKNQFLSQNCQFLVKNVISIGIVNDGLWRDLYGFTGGKK